MTYTVPKPGERLTFNQLCGMAEFVFHLRMAYETITRAREKHQQPQASASLAQTVDRARLEMAEQREPSHEAESFSPSSLQRESLWR